MNLNELRERVTELMREHAGALGMRASAVEAHYILNWGGFGNPSFRITDGQRTYHLKLTDWPEGQESLRRQFEWRELLSRRYRAPRALQQVRIPDSPYTGLLFEHVEGGHPDLSTETGVLTALLHTLVALHSDAELRQLLARPGPPASCLDIMQETFTQRLLEEVDLIEAGCPPFLTRELIAWMRRELTELEEAALATPAFAVPAEAPTHGDIWSNNLLVAGGGSWYLLDWDGLALGDPALDFAMALGPAVHYAGEADALARLPFVPEAAFRDRMELYLRAWLLDWLIDPLADYAEADFAPDAADTVRAAKKEQHERHLALYRERYG